MKQLARTAVAPLFSLFLIMLGNSYFNTFLSVRTSMDGAPNWIVGALHSSYYLGLLLGCFNMERCLQRVGHIRSFAIFGALYTSLILSQGLAFNPFTSLLFRFLVGCCCAGFFIIVESWLLLLSNHRSRGKLLSLYMLSLYCAQGFGQFLLQIGDITSFFPFSLVAILSSLSIIPLCLMKSSAPEASEPIVLKLHQVLLHAPLGFFGALLSGMIISSFLALGPIYGKESLFSMHQISQYMGYTVLGGLTLQWPIGYLSDIFDRRHVLSAVSFILLTLLTFIIFGSGYPFAVKLSLSVLFGGFAFTLYPISISYTSDRIPTANIISIACVMLIFYGMGNIVGPLMAPLLMSTFGPRGLFIFMALLTLTLLLLSSSKAGVRIAPKAKSFFSMPRTSPGVLKLDPRSSEEDKSKAVVATEELLNMTQVSKEK